MVFFICECQETLKKAAVERHRFSCRRCIAVTCVDCNVRYSLEEYAGHTSCMTEAEKYEKTAYRERPAKRDPQAEWVAVVATAAAAGGEHARTLSSLANYSNVPRKVKPFIAFAKNSLRIFDERKLTALFTYVQGFMPPKPVAPVKGGDAEEVPEDATPALPDAPAAGAKRPRNDDLAAPFSPRKFILSHLGAAKKRRAKSDKLREAVIAAAAEARVTDAAYDKCLLKLVKKGNIEITEDGKYVSLAAAASGDEGGE